MSRARHSSPSQPAARPPKPRIGVSSCLLGENVRWNGANKRHDLIAGVLAQHIELVPLCPEVAIGLGVPRPPIRLEARGAAVRAVANTPQGKDVSAELAAEGQRAAAAHPGLNGYIFKSGSPSCGLEKVNVYGMRGKAARAGTGLYAQALLRRRPDLPAIEEGALDDPARRDAFLDQVAAHARWQNTAAGRVSAGRLAAFHDAHRLLLLTRGPGASRRMDAVLAKAGAQPSVALAREYFLALLDALARPATGAGRKRAWGTAAAEVRGCLDEDDASLLDVLLFPSVSAQSSPMMLLMFLGKHLTRCSHPELQRQVLLRASPLQAALSTYDEISARSGPVETFDADV
jgi:uncharacterized protein YbbK (DUF523 family)